MANMFALILVIATLVTGILWCVDKFFFAPKRRERQAAAQAAAGDSLDKATLKKVAPKPGWLETGASVFPVLAIVLIVRSFIYEPFQIPSGSMMPTLLIGDFILVEKFAYGIKDPIYQKTLIETGHPKRGDIVVFKYPEDPKLDYIKRAVGLPGDKVTYDPVSKELTIQPGCSSGQACENALRSLTPTWNRAISFRPSHAVMVGKRPADSLKCRKTKPKKMEFVFPSVKRHWVM